MIFDRGSTKNLMHMQLDKGYDIIQYCWEKNQIQMLDKATNNDNCRKLSKSHWRTGLAGLMFVRRRTEMKIRIGEVETGSS